MFFPLLVVPALVEYSQQTQQPGLILGVVFDKDNKEVGQFVADRFVVLPDGRVIYRDAKTGDHMQVKPGFGVSIVAASRVQGLVASLKDVTK